MNPKEIFQIAASDINCNTSYPLRKKFFERYRTDIDIMESTEALSLYYHIPFCKHLCRFCEYTRFLCRDVEQQNDYITKLIAQSEEFFSSHKIKELYGLDIGGGTPTSLDLPVLNRFLDYISEIRQEYNVSESFEPSIEFSFSAIDEAKIRCIAEHKIPRMSTGIQVFDDRLLGEMRRLPQTLDHMEKMTEVIHRAGIGKLNIDLMYGFPNQTDIMLSNSLYSIKVLQPEQVTLYEMRYNRNGLDSASIDRDVLFGQYEYMYNGLTDLGYKGRFGQNTFSKLEDEGVSSYLYSRMFLGRPYKGFGISAQSMSDKGIAYNILKSDNSHFMPSFEKISEEYRYLLPKEELAAKYICISLYSGRFYLPVLERILCCDPLSYYHNEFRFLTEHQYVEITDSICSLTKEGFRLYGAVAALFWSRYHREQYIKMKQEEK